MYVTKVRVDKIRAYILVLHQNMTQEYACAYIKYVYTSGRRNNFCNLPLFVLPQSCVLLKYTFAWCV